VARIRTIKPEFFTSLTIADLPLEARLTFIGLWTHVDDEGRCVNDARLIKAAVWPLDDRTSGEVAKDLQLLSESSLITQYKVGDRSYLLVNSWREHQKINRPTASKFPGLEMADEICGRPVTHTDHTATTSGNEGSESDQDALTDNSVRTHGGLTGGKEQGTGNREQGKEGMRAPQAERETLPVPSPAPQPKRAPKPGSDDDPDWLKFWSIYPLKKSKEGARRAWAAALKKTTAAEIIAGAERYRNEPGRKPEFTKHPTTWLNQGCWADEVTPAAPRQQGDWRDVSGQDHSGWTKRADNRAVSTPEAIETGWNRKGTTQ